MKRITISNINNHIYRLNDNNETMAYLVIGTKKALLIDTLMGYEDVNKVVHSLTSLPVMVVHTHAHLDHIGGSIYFDEVYLHPDDFPIKESHMKYVLASKPIKDYFAGGGQMKETKWKAIHSNDIIDLGGIMLEVYSVPGHTPGCICLLDREDRILFSGDGICRYIWMQLEESLPLVEFKESLLQIELIRDEFDTILTGHSYLSENADLLELLICGVNEIIEGKTNNDRSTKFHGAPCKIHFYKPDEPNRQIVYKKQPY